MSNLYGGLIELDSSGYPITPDLVLAFRGGTKQGVIENVQSLTNMNSLMNAAEISFDVYKKVGSKMCSLWNDLKDFKLVYIPHLDSAKFNPWYELSVEVDENDSTIKHCRGVHLQESELSQLSLHNIEINTEDDILRDDYSPTKIYNPNKPEASLLHRILHDKGTHYAIEYVDNVIANLQRTFSWNGSTIKDAFDDIAQEVECIFKYGESLNNDGKIHRTISIYDLNDKCMDCGERGSFIDHKCPKCGSKNLKYGYGHDSGIFINTENFAGDITYSSNADDVKNCFRLVAGDDLMTATVKNINPSGSQYIWYLSEELRKDMSPALKDKLAQYDVEYKSYVDNKQIDIPQSSINEYNALINKYKQYDNTLVTFQYPVLGYAKLTDLYYSALNLYSILKTTLAPAYQLGTKTTAEKEAAKLTNNSLSPLGIMNANIASTATVTSALQSYARVFIDTSLYRVKADGISYSNKTWRGTITLTSYTDKSDTATTPELLIVVSDVSADYIKCQLEKAMKKNEVDASGTVELFKKSDTAFKLELANYSVDNLSILANITRGCLDVLIQQGVADPKNSLYNSIYLPYYNKNIYIQNELRERESEVLKLRGDKDRPIGLLDFIEVQRGYIYSKLDLRTFLGETLWSEFCSFRRDDVYQNDNFISDGLSDQDLIKQAKEFVKRAERDLIKAATLQHSISCNLNNLLLVRENETANTPILNNVHIQSVDSTYAVKSADVLSPLLDNFDVGNWVYLEIDDKVYKLRLIDYTIDYDNLDTLNVEFSDVTYGIGYMSDTQDLLSKVQSMSTSYNTVVHQANKGNHANSQILDMVENGLNLTNKKIVSDSKNQDLLIDETGMIMRKKNEYGDGFNPEQIKIINHGFYYTTDDWKTVKTGLGKFVYYDPKDGQYKDGYGLIANHIVGNIILGNEVGIYNTSGSLQFDDRGLTITSDPNDVNPELFTLQKKNPDGTFTKYIYVDDMGNIKINGDVIDLSVTDGLISHIDKTLSNMKIGVRNLIRNSKTMVFDKYGLIKTTTVYVVDESGNRLTDELGNRLTF